MSRSERRLLVGTPRGAPTSLRLPAALLLAALLSWALSEPLSHAHDGLADPHDCPACRWENSSSCEPAVAVLPPLPLLLPADAVRPLGATPLPLRAADLAPARGPPAL